MNISSFTRAFRMIRRKRVSTVLNSEIKKPLSFSSFPASNERSYQKSPDKSRYSSSKCFWFFFLPRPHDSFTVSFYQNLGRIYKRITYDFVFKMAIPDVQAAQIDAFLRCSNLSLNRFNLSLLISLPRNSSFFCSLFIPSST